MSKTNHALTKNMKERNAYKNESEKKKINIRKNNNKRETIAKQITNNKKNIWKHENGGIIDLAFESLLSARSPLSKLRSRYFVLCGCFFLWLIFNNVFDRFLFQKMCLFIGFVQWFSRSLSKWYFVIFRGFSIDCSRSVSMGFPGVSPTMSECYSMFFNVLSRFARVLFMVFRTLFEDVQCFYPGLHRFSKVVTGFVFSKIFKCCGFLWGCDLCLFFCRKGGSRTDGRRGAFI